MQQKFRDFFDRKIYRCGEDCADLPRTGIGTNISNYRRVEISNGFESGGFFENLFKILNGGGTTDAQERATIISSSPVFLKNDGTSSYSIGVYDSFWKPISPHSSDGIIFFYEPLSNSFVS